MSAIAQFVETARESTTGDRTFYRRMPPIFELEVPASASPIQSSFLFPLPLPPTDYELDEAFAVEITPGQDAGLTAEESGILWHDIKISGTTGFDVRPYNGSYFGLIRRPQTRATTRDIMHKSLPGAGLSGHRYFEYLQDVFRLYSELKQSPETAQNTRMILHVPKDDEHFVVLPQRFTLRRNSPRDRVLYRYQIDLTGVALGTAPHAPAAEDRNLLEQIQDTVGSIRAGLQLARAAVNDLNNLRAEIESAVRSVIGILNDVGGILQAVNDFVSGTVDFIKTAKTALVSSVNEIERQLALFDSQLPDPVKQLLRDASDGLQQILTHPEAFIPSTDVIVQAAFRRGIGLFGVAAEALSAASAAAPASSFAALDAAGLGPGDAARDELLRRAPEPLPRYRSVFAHQLDGHDTLEALAGRYLGDARLWRHIVIVNNLSPPYLSDERMPGTIGMGDTLLIPSVAPPVRPSQSAAVLGASPDESIEDQFLGRDWLISIDPATGLEDWVIDTDSGSTDLRTVSGGNNFAQGLVTRIRTRRRSDIFYLSMGTELVPGIGLYAAELEGVRFRVAQAIQDDPRTAAIRRIDVSDAISPDRLSTEVDVETRIRSDTNTIAVRAETQKPAAI